MGKSIESELDSKINTEPPLEHWVWRWPSGKHCEDCQGRFPQSKERCVEAHKLIAVDIGGIIMIVPPGFPVPGEPVRIL